MSRGRWLALASIAVLVVAALALGLRSEGSAPAGPSEQVVALQRAAGLQPCPTGLGPALPALTLRCLGGGPDVQLDAPLSGGPTVVNVWGSWCEPCREEIPDLIDLSAELAGRVSVVGVVTVDTDDSALSYADFVGMTYPSVVDDDGETSAAFGQGTPKTLFLAADGRLVHTEIRTLSRAELDALVAEHLGVRV